MRLHAQWRMHFLLFLWLKTVCSLWSLPFTRSYRHCVLVRGIAGMSPPGNDFSATEEGFIGSSLHWKQPTESSRLISSCSGINVQPACPCLPHPHSSSFAFHFLQSPSFFFVFILIPWSLRHFLDFTFIIATCCCLCLLFFLSPYSTTFSLKYCCPLSILLIQTLIGSGLEKE